jgi:hypothetical protein
LISVITLDLDIAITTTAPATGTGTGIEGSVTATGATADTIGPVDFGLLTDVRTVGPFKTASANHIGATEISSHAPNPPRLAAFNLLWELAPLRRDFFFQVPGTK